MHKLHKKQMGLAIASMLCCIIDIEQFSNQEVVGATSTEYVPVPVGEYNSIIEKIAVRDGVSDEGKQWVALDVTHIIDDAGVRQVMERDKVTLIQSVFLNLTDDGRLNLGKGQNVPLGLLREACGLNDPSVPFKFTMLIGKVLRISVIHKMYQGAPQANINKVSALS